MGLSKGTLHYMKQKAKSEKPFTLNAHVRERLELEKVRKSNKSKNGEQKTHLETITSTLE